MALGAALAVKRGITPCCLGSLDNHRRIRGDAIVIDADFQPLAA